MFVFADAPRNESEVKLCDETKSIIKNIDWDCELKTLFSDRNLGCGLGPKTAIDWFFNNVDEGIIFEDDILPSADFFYFCQTLLEYYRNSEKVMHISAMNFLKGKKFSPDSYYFSHVISPWGWATWKRAWEKNDFLLSDLSEKLPLLDILPYYKTELQFVKEGKVIAWDYQWLYSIIKNNGVGIVPSVNLALNTGVDSDATNTTNTPEWAKNMSLEHLDTIKHPSIIKLNKEADNYTFNLVIPDSSSPSLFFKIKKLFSFINK